MDNRMILHQELGTTGKWVNMSFCEQMANIGSEVSRACKWKAKQKPDMMWKALERGLELLDLSIEGAAGSRLKELLRAREVMCDFFVGENAFGSTEKQMRGYFDAFAFAVRS